MRMLLKPNHIHKQKNKQPLNNGTRKQAATDRSAAGHLRAPVKPSRVGGDSEGASEVAALRW
jgi:hypothetical protein